ncbi:MAG: enoyl-CoA hydratase/isomerase family protein, partial [Rhodococcus sp. (in: high G+C Gram-positive bacteria)]
MSEAVSAEPEVLIDKRDGLGRIVLNRPRAINALNHAMVRRIAAALAEWSGDDAVRAVLITGAGERGLCAGGDIVSIYHDAKDGGTGSREFWREEYILNAAIANYGKARLSAGDAIACGFADHFVPSEKIDGFVQALSETTVEAALAAFTAPAPVSELLAQRGWIDAAYSAGSVAEIVSRLRSSGVAEAEKAAEQVVSKSPTACAVTLKSLRRARQADSLEEVLNDEFRVSVACLSSPDLVEGIRAQVV